MAKSAAPKWNPDFERILALAPTSRSNPALFAALFKTQAQLQDDELSHINNVVAASGVAASLHKMTPDVAASQFAKFSDQQKGMLQQIGYAPPAATVPADNGGVGGFFSTMFSGFSQGGGPSGGLVTGLAQMANTLNGGMQNAATAGGGAVMGALGYGADQVSHLYRTVQAEGNVVADANANPGNATNYYHVKTDQGPLGMFGQFWDATSDNNSNGKQGSVDQNWQYDMNALSKLKKDAPNEDQFLAAKAVADAGPEGSKDAVTQAISDAQQKGGTDAAVAMEKFLTGDEGANLVTSINATKASIGRNLAQTFNLDPQSKAFTLVSGGADATFDILTDPVLIGGKIVGSVRAAKYAIGAVRGASGASESADAIANISARLDTIGQEGAVQRYFEGGSLDKGLLSHISVLRDPATKGTEARVAATKALATTYKDSAHLHDFLRGLDSSVPLRDTQDVMNALKQQEGIAAVLNGHTAFKQIIIPYRTVAGDLTKGFTQGISAPVANGVNKALAPAVDALKAASEVTAPDLLPGMKRLYETSSGHWSSSNAAAGAAKGAGRRFLDVTEPELKTLPKVAKKGGGTSFRYMPDDATIANRAAPFEYTAKTGIDNTAMANAGSALDSLRRQKVAGWAYRASLVANRVTTMIPEREMSLGVNKAGVPVAGRQVYLLARSFAPKNFAYQMQTAFESADLAGRHQIMDGLFNTMGESMGITHSTEGREFWQNFISSNRTRAYGIAGHDTVDGTAMGLYPSQFTEKVSLPDWAQAYRYSAKVGALSKSAGFLDTDAMDYFTQKYFKPAVLLRPALAWRNAGEEILNQVMREGMTSYALGRSAARELRGADAYGRFYRVMTRPFASAAARTGMGKAGTIAEGDAALTLDEVLAREAAGRGRALTDAEKTATANVHKADIEAQLNAGKHIDPVVLSDYTDLQRIKNARAQRVQRIDYMQKQLNKPRDLFITHLSSKLRTAGLEKAFGRDNWQLLKEDWDNNPEIQRAYGREVLDLVRGSIQDERGNEVRLMRDPHTLKRRVVRMQYAGDYGLTNTEGLPGASKWAMRLQHLADDDLGSIALKYANDPEVAMVHMRDALARNPQWAAESTLIKSVGPDEYLQRVLADTRAHLTRQDGTFNDALHGSLVKDVKGRPVIQSDRLSGQYLHSAVPDAADRPKSVIGQENVLGIDDTPGVIGNLVNKGFAALGDHTTFLSKEPIFFYNYMKRRVLAQQLSHDLIMRDAGMSEKEIADRAAGVGPNGFLPHTTERNMNPGPHEGQLNMYYHGTGADFTQFDNAQQDFKGYFGNGHYVTMNPEYAHGYVPRVGEKGQLPNIKRLHLDVRNPLIDDLHGNGIDKVSGIIDRMLADPKVKQWFTPEELANDSAKGDILGKMIAHIRDHEATHGVGAGPKGATPFVNQMLRAFEGRMGEGVLGSGEGADAYKHAAAALTSVLKSDGHDAVKMFEELHGNNYWHWTQAGNPELQAKIDHAKSLYDSGQEIPQDLWDEIHPNLTYAHAPSMVVFDSKSIVPGYVPAPTDILAKHAANQNWIHKQFSEDAFHGAIHDTLQYVDDASVRSQYAVIARAWMPFWRAQQEFYVRWAKTFRYHPESLRKAQILMGGLHSSGLVQKDDQGDDYFIFPGSQALTNGLSSSLAKIGIGTGDASPFPMRGYVRFLNQGIDPKSIAPSFSPIVGVPLQALGNLFPEMQPLNAALLGDQGQSSTWYGQLLPTPIRRLWTGGVISQNDTQELIQSSKMQAAYMEANGQGLPANATPDEIEQYKDRLTSGARVLAFVRAVYGLVTPAPPSASDPTTPLKSSITGDGFQYLNDEFRALVSKMGPAAAYEVWNKNHPDQMPFTVSSTQAAGGASFVPSVQAEQFITTNKDFVSQYKNVAAFWFPQGGQFDSQSFRHEMAIGLRQYKGLDEYIKDLKLSNQLQSYFDARDQRDQMIADANSKGDKAAVNKYNADWSSYSAQAQSQNAFLASYLADGAARANERVQKVNELRAAVTAAPAGEVTDGIKTFLTSYDQYQSQLAGLKGDKTDAGKVARDQVKADWNDYAAEAGKHNENVNMLYQRLFRWMG